MKTLAAALITALVVFTLATAWMELVQPQLEIIAQASAPKAKAESKASKKKPAERPEESDEDEDPDVMEEPPAKVAAKPARLKKKQREEATLSEIAKERLIAQLTDVKDHETKLIAREETLRMLYDDIRSELAAVEDLRRRSANELAIAERRVLDAASKSGVASAADGTSEPLSSKNKVTAESRIASVIQDLASQGNVMAAASLLSGMKDREVAKVLTSLSARDPRLALRISDQVQAAKQEPLRR